MSIVGYLDRWSYQPGSEVLIHADSEDSQYLVDLVSLDSQQEVGPLLSLGPFEGKRQHSSVGSMIFIPSQHPARLAQVHCEMWIWPTLPTNGSEQVLIHWRDSATGDGFTLLLDGRGTLRLDSDVGRRHGSVSLPEVAVRSRNWYWVAASVDTKGLIRTAIHDLSVKSTHEAAERFEASGDDGGLVIDGPITIGAAGTMTASGVHHIARPYNGKIESPLLTNAVPDRANDDGPPDSVPDAAVIGRWDFSQIDRGMRVLDSGSGSLHGWAVNLPATRMKGHRWSWRQSLSQQASNRNAVHFHHDDVGDRAWEVSVSMTLPGDVLPGAYAIILDDGTTRTELPLFVSHRLSEETAQPRLAVLMPTFTYLAYGNLRGDSQGESPMITAGHLEAGLHEFDPSNPIDALLARRPDLGSSIYNRHEDGSGVCYATRLRPILTFDSSYNWWGTRGPRHFSSDVLLLRWLRSEGHEFDVLTDEDVDSDGFEKLQYYDVLITGSHPEYVTGSWLAALEDWLNHGGRLMYLGGNGLFWVTATSPDLTGTIEVRRGWAGSRDWESEPGEEWLSLEEAVGGLWRHRGTPPQRLVGVGFTAMGWGSSAGYSRCAESFQADVAFVFEGISEEEVIGGFDSGLGPALSGAAGDEIDRTDPRLGTPSRTRLLATSSGRHGRFQRANEDVLQLSSHLGSTQDPDVRADMVLIPGDHGGYVFSVGSINWIPFLASNAAKNNVVTVTRNVLRKFLEPTERELS